MRKLIACLAVFCFIGLTVAVDECKNNRLLTAFGFTSVGNDAQTVEGLKYCKSLQNGKSCCSADTVNRFQEQATALTEKLTTIVSKRDKAIVDTRDRIIPGLTASIQKLSENAAKAITKMNQQSQGTGTGTGTGTITVGTGTGTGTDLGGALGGAIFGAMAQAMEQLAKQATDALPSVKSEFKNFQKSRVSCVVDLVKLQASAWCLACDPSFATKGVSGSTITMGDNTCKRLQSSCYKFIVGAVLQSAMLSFRTVSSMIEAMATLMEGIANNDYSGLANMGNLFTGSATTTDNDLTPVKLPDGCKSDADCSWICSNMIKNSGMVDDGVLAAGGVADTSATNILSSGRLLGEEDEPVVEVKVQKRRVLAESEWNPDQDEAGITVTFKEDPSGVGEEKKFGGILKSGLMCLVGMLIALLF